MKYIFLFSVYLFMHNLNAIQNKIIESFDLNIFQEEVLKLNTKSLILFDIGNVIIRRTDNLFSQGKSNKQLRKYIFNKYQKYCNRNNINSKLTNNEKINLWSTLKNSSPNILFSEQTRKQIKSIQNRKIPVIALTKVSAGIGKIKDKIENDRINLLLNLNINFDDTFKINQLNLIDSNNENSKPIFKKGILFADKGTKGDTLKAFLDKIKYRPNEIIMIDDQLDYLKSVSKILESLNINFIGIHYRAHEKFIQKPKNKLNKLQINHYFKHKQWLIDSKAEKLLLNH